MRAARTVSHQPLLHTKHVVPSPHLTQGYCAPHHTPSLPPSLNVPAPLPPYHSLCLVGLLELLTHIHLALITQHGVAH